MKTRLLRMSAVPLIFLICLSSGCQKQEETSVAEKQAVDDLRLAEIPQVVMNGLKARFPMAEIHKWTKEREDTIVVYDFEFMQDGWRFEADIREDGSIHDWEKAIDPADLPEAAMRVVETEHPEAAIKEVMEVTIVRGGKDVLEGYEVVLQRLGTKEIEVMLEPDGTILEESGQSE